MVEGEIVMMECGLLKNCDLLSIAGFMQRISIFHTSFSLTMTR